ncbi:hypothetical protein CJ419_08945 [Vibrio navarrensis]|nr:hypothetical protein [Vibrio navarrensis]
MINNIYGGLLSILWRTAQIVFFGGGRAEQMVLWSCGPVVLWSCGPVGKAKSVTRESKALGSRKARAEERSEITRD